MTQGQHWVHPCFRSWRDQDMSNCFIQEGDCDRESSDSNSRVFQHRGSMPNFIKEVFDHGQYMLGQLRHLGTKLSRRLLSGSRWHLPVYSATAGWPHITALSGEF